ncbi:MAG: FkbM family methyltransferase [Pseudomonadota bacterium]
MKRHLLKSQAGTLLLKLRSVHRLRTIPHANPEISGQVANDIIADKLITGLCRDHGAFLDIGAHLGSVFSQVHRANRTVKIVAIEADPQKAAFLRGNHGYCTVINVAVGESEGHVDFFVSGQGGYSSLSAEETKQAGDSTCIQVEMSRLDTLFPDQSFDVIKMDIQGAELAALRGGASLIARSAPIIFFESVWDRVSEFGTAPRDVFAWFTGHGFDVVPPDRVGHDSQPMPLEAFLDSHQYPRRTLNYVAIPPHRRQEARARARQILQIS